jgi:hypothetical protein
MLNRIVYYGNDGAVVSEVENQSLDISIDFRFASLYTDCKSLTLTKKEIDQLWPVTSNGRWEKERSSGTPKRIAASQFMSYLFGKYYENKVRKRIEDRKLLDYLR